MADISGAHHRKVSSLARSHTQPDTLPSSSSAFPTHKTAPSSMHPKSTHQHTHTSKDNPDGRQALQSFAEASVIHPTTRSLGRRHTTVGTSPYLRLVDGSAARVRRVRIKALGSFALLLLFTAVVLSSHAYVILAALVVQVWCFKELSDMSVQLSLVIRRGGIVLASDTSPKPEKKHILDNSLPLFRTLNWYFLAVANYFLYGQRVTTILKEFFPEKDAFFGNLAAHHRFVSFSLYTLGLVFFVRSLKYGFYRFQFGQFGWTHMNVLTIVTSFHMIVYNVHEGMIWFILPSVIIALNETLTMWFGSRIGRKPLNEMYSTWKTWRGHLLAGALTVVFSFLFSGFLAKYEYAVCPIKHLEWEPQIGKLVCEPSALFVAHEYDLPILKTFFSYFGLETRFVFYPVQIHAVFLACFGSIIAPFGGFFTGGFKRAFGIKGFGVILPGFQYGLIDRVDTHFLMAMFVHSYYGAFVQGGNSTALEFSRLIHVCLSLSTERKMELFRRLQDSLIEGGMLPKETAQAALGLS